jgi:diguanylate cyclase (GGDEF)-like protein/PAS domain S-box-containing protein
MKQASILVVEDERIVAFDLKQQLEALGYRVAAVVPSGELAVEKAAELKPDLVLMDIHLEGAMDGVEAAERIHACLRIPVIFLTAYAEDETLSRAQASLPFGYLIKPLEVREVHATIQMALVRRAAEVAVESSEERLQLALDAAELDVWEWNAATGQVSLAGHHIDALFGSAPEPVSETHDAFLARVHPENRGAIERALQEALTQGSPLNLVFRYLRSTGQAGWLEAHAQVYSGTVGTAARLVGVVKDITERKQMEEQLRQAEVVFETTAEGIFIMDEAQRIASVNPAFTAITGYRPEEALGQDPDELLHARRHSDQFYPQLEATLQGQWQGETYCRRKNGEVFPALESVSVVRDAEGVITHYVAVFADITAIRRAEKQLQHLAHHDPLTGLPNRLLFNDRLDQTLEWARRERQRCALLFFDLDGFKVINDTLGHGCGDLLLQALAARIKVALRRSDTVARLGGDELVVIMADIAQAQDGARLARKLLETLAAPVELVGERIAMSASVGISVYPDDGTDRHALLRAADTAMYSAKAQGRNRFCFHTEEMAVRALERLGIEQGLKRARDPGLHGSLSTASRAQRWRYHWH